MDAPGERTVKELSRFRARTVDGTYFATRPLNDGELPAGSVMVKVSVSKVWRTVRGSFNSFSSTSPVFTSVATTWRALTLETSEGPNGMFRGNSRDETNRNIPVRDRESPGAADTAAAKTNATKAERTEVENILGRGLSSSC